MHASGQNHSPKPDGLRKWLVPLSTAKIVVYSGSDPRVGDAPAESVIQPAPEGAPAGLHSSSPKAIDHW